MYVTIRQATRLVVSSDYKEYGKGEALLENLARRDLRDQLPVGFEKVVIR